MQYLPISRKTRSNKIRTVTANGQVSKGFVYLNGSMYDLNRLVTPRTNGLTDNIGA
jgi:hypothetical protein